MKSLIAAAVAMGVLAAQACAQSWSLGSHVSAVSVHSEYEGSGTTTVLSWPSNVLAYQPGLRIGFADRTHGHEIVLDSGMLVIDEAGSTLTELLGTVGYQYAYHAAGAFSPFANASIGYYREGGAAGTSSPMLYGVGLGIRRAVSERHGCVRAELRVDRLRSDPQFGRPRLTMYGLRFGFDLWMGSSSDVRVGGHGHREVDEASEADSARGTGR